MATTSLNLVLSWCAQLCIAFQLNIRHEGLDKVDNHHEFCRLLYRLKSNYQLSQMKNVDGYNEWLTLLAEVNNRIAHLYFFFTTTDNIYLCIII